MPAPPRAATSDFLRSAHRGVLGLLVLACFWIVFQPSVEPGVPPASLTVTALVLALGLIFARSLTYSAALPARSRPGIAALALLCALGVGVTAVATATVGEAREAGLGFALGGLILAIRSPSLEAPTPRRR